MRRLREGDEIIVIPDHVKMRFHFENCKENNICIICDRKTVGKHSIAGYPAHRKCMVAYNSWKVQYENPSMGLEEQRLEQVRQNLQELYSRLEER